MIVNCDSQRRFAVALLVKHFGISVYVANVLIAYAESDTQTDLPDLAPMEVLIEATNDVVTALMAMGMTGGVVE